MLEKKIQNKHILSTQKAKYFVNMKTTNLCLPRFVEQTNDKITVFMSESRGMVNLTMLNV